MPSVVEIVEEKPSEQSNGDSGMLDQDQIQNAQEDECRERIRVKNRRKAYLDSNPSYFENGDLELAGKFYAFENVQVHSNIASDPLLYDRCVRRFQSAGEREADGKAKGYSRVLEADLYRSEAKLAALAGCPLDGQESSSDGKSANDLAYVPGPDGQVLPEDEDEVPQSKEEGLDRWKEAMTLRFLQGKDEDFEYAEVDGSEEWDVVERRDAEEKWFEDEEPQWAADEHKVKESETGIQDF